MRVNHGWSQRSIGCTVVAQIVFLACLSWAVLAVPIHAEAGYCGQTVWDLPEVAEDSLDVGLWSLIIAKECDSTVDIPWCLGELDRMVAEIRRMLAGRSTDMDMFQATRMYQFDSGPWNGHQPFTYDLDDPMGEEPRTRLLSTYLKSRKGNCVSMPVLFIALMDRVDPSVPFHGVMAPLHLFCQMQDRQSGEVFNVESTSGGHSAPDDWYAETMDILQGGIDSGIYLNALSRRELLAELVCLLVSRHRDASHYAEALRFAELALVLNPRSVTALVQKGALMAALGRLALEDAMARGESITETKQAELMLYSDESREYIEKARALGWVPETDSQRNDYLRAVSEAKRE